MIVPESSKASFYYFTTNGMVRYGISLVDPATTHHLYLRAIICMLSVSGQESVSTDVFNGKVVSQYSIRGGAGFCLVAVSNLDLDPFRGFFLAVSHGMADDHGRQIFKPVHDN